MESHTLTTSSVASAQSAPTQRVVVFSVDDSSDTVGLFDSFTGTPVTPNFTNGHEITWTP